MDKKVQDFINFCKDNLEFNASINYEYQSLSVCLIDCIYSLRANYYKVTVPIVERYADAFMNGDKTLPGDTLMDLLNHIDSCGGKENFVETVIKNHQKSGGVPKEEVVINLAKKLLGLNINSLHDFSSYKNYDLLDTVIRSVRGVGDAGTSYLFMLAGDQNRCKPDIHIHECIKDACGVDVSNDECQIMLEAAVEELHKDKPSLTVRELDGIIWKKYAKG